MCSNCLNVLAQLKRIEEKRTQIEHGNRIAARAEANRPWTFTEMDPQTRDAVMTGVRAGREVQQPLTGELPVYAGLYE